VDILSKYNHGDIIENAHSTLQENYNLAHSPLVQLGKAELLMIQFNYKKAYDILEKLLNDAPYDMEEGQKINFRCSHCI
jgi:hypothetical protein